MGRRPHFTSKLAKARNAVLGAICRPFRSFSPRTQFLTGFSFLVIATTLLLSRAPSNQATEVYREGEVMRGTVVSPADIIGGVDNLETERRRNAARDAASPVFRYDASAAEAAANSFRDEWNNLAGETQARTTDLAFFGKRNTAAARAIAAHRFNPNDLGHVVAAIHDTQEGYIYEDADRSRLRGAVTVVDANGQNPQVVALARLAPLSLARGNLRSRLSLDDWSPPEQAALAEAASELIKPNLTFDQTATDAAREEEANRTPPVLISLKRNQVVAREGDMVTRAMLDQFAAIRAYGEHGRPGENILGLLFLVIATYLILWRYTEHRDASTRLPLSKRRTFALVGSAVVVETVLMRLGFLIGDGMAAQSDRAPFDNPAIWSFAIPFAAASLLVAMLVDTQLGLITGVITAVLAGLLAPDGGKEAVFVVISCAAAVYGIGRYRERQSVTLAGLVVGGVNMLTALALIAYSQQQLTVRTLLTAIGCGAVGGLLTIIFTAGGLPINESLFGILTDVKLLELSNADLPILSQLALRAPGTNQHSHALGQLTEDACRAVGANPLLARIGSLYHDIGKVAAPDYFIENQSGHNPHDRLRPAQSAKIITSHVSYGMKLAREIGLPKQIADFIPQHHGTRTLHFFLRKAQNQARNGEVIDEADFRYAGPKPKFKEAAIMMLADSCEAAARSLAHPDPESICAIVIRIFDAIISDGQLDDCDLSLRELTRIREAIINSLTALYHARVDYPGFNKPPLQGDGQEHAEAGGVTYERTFDGPTNQGNKVEEEALSQSATP